MPGKQSRSLYRQERADLWHAKLEAIETVEAIEEQKLVTAMQQAAITGSHDGESNKMEIDRDDSEESLPSGEYIRRYLNGGLRQQPAAPSSISPCTTESPPRTCASASDRARPRPAGSH